MYNRSKQTLLILLFILLLILVWRNLINYRQSIFQDVLATTRDTSEELICIDTWSFDDPESHEAIEVPEMESEVKESKQEDNKPKDIQSNYEKPKVTRRPIKTWAPQDVQDLIDYARDLSHDLDFILTIEWESWWYREAVWDGWTSYWLCQWHQPGHVNRWVDNDDPTIATPYAMIDTCWNSWQAKWDLVWERVHAYYWRMSHLYKYTFE